jgi:hypothetical protein
MPPGVLGQRMAKRYILAAIYLAARGGHRRLPAGAAHAHERLHLLGRDGPAVAVHRAAHQRHRGADLRRAVHVDAGRLRVLQPPDRLVSWACGWAASCTTAPAATTWSGTSPWPGRLRRADQPARLVTLADQIWACFLGFFLTSKVGLQPPSLNIAGVSSYENYRNHRCVRRHWRRNGAPARPPLKALRSAWCWPRATKIGSGRRWQPGAGRTRRAGAGGATDVSQEEANAAAYCHCRSALRPHRRAHQQRRHVGAGAVLEDVRAEDLAWYEQLMRINLWGSVWCTHAALPLAETKPRQYRCRIKSLAGLVGVPGRTAYSATKFAMTGFFEALRAETQNSRGERDNRLSRRGVDQDPATMASTRQGFQRAPAG